MSFCKCSQNGDKKKKKQDKKKPNQVYKNISSDNKVEFRFKNLSNQHNINDAYTLHF